MLKFLDCFTHAEEWERLVAGTDVHFSPALYRAFGGGMLAVNDYVAQPFRHQGGRWIGNAYNFGGPVGDYRFTGGFACEFDAWKASQGLNERCTLNPFLDQGIALMEREFTSKNIVYVDLERELILRQTTKHCIAKAMNAGVVIEQVEPSAENVMVFEGIYNDAMERKRAALHWHYSPGFFFRVLTELGPQRSALILSKYHDRVESGCLLIFNHETAYYHWAARRHGFPNIGIDHLQVYKAINWARTRGFKRLCLGGGLQESDGLFTFKSGFSSLKLPCLSYVTHAEEELAVA